MVKNLPVRQETRVQSLGWEVPLEKVMAIQSTPVFLPVEFHGQRSLVGYSPWGRKESDTIDRLTLEKQRKVKKGLDISEEIVCAELRSGQFHEGVENSYCSAPGVVTGPPQAGKS